ncbi:MAG TPA: LysM peptidoglycan-binding domain-containing protein, partial [Candidatus Eisenbacteria bacterium]
TPAAGPTEPAPDGAPLAQLPPPETLDPDTESVPDSTDTARILIHVPRIETPFDDAHPQDSQVIHAWERVYYANLDMEPSEPDSVLFFRYQALLTHLDPGMISAEAPRLRDRAVDLRQWITRSRDAAWQRWQVDLQPPPEPAPVDDTNLAAITPDDHPRVQKWINVFTGPSRERFAIWIYRSGAYRPLMEQILKEEGVPVELIAMVFIESGFSLVAKSRASAVGPWQFIRETGKRYGLTINNHRDERRDFVLATRAAARYLRDLYGYFGDWKLAMAAYNCGEGRVFRQISKQGTNDFYALDLPRETEDYVPEIHAALAIIRDPQAYGFSTVIADPIEYVEQELPGPVRVADLAAHCAMSIDEVKLLNPAWLRAVTPADGKPVTARLPGSIMPGISLASLPLAPKEETVARNATVKVRKGDTMSKIARRNGVSVSALARENGISTKAKLKAGRYLRLPDGVGGGSSSSGKSSGSSKKSKSSSSGNGVAFHTVKRGDTLSAICERYGLSMNELKRLNGLSGSSIQAGQKLKLRG